MYITAMWLRSPRKVHGVNAYVHLHPRGLPPERWEVTRDPGKIYIARRELPAGGGNFVEAYLDAVVEDGDYSMYLFDQAIKSMADAVERSAMNPLRKDFEINGGRIGVRFSINRQMEDAESKMAVFELLRRTLLDWLRQIDNQITGASARHEMNGMGPK